ncbi:hypothetical protein [Pontiella sulfatireligans]|uniref:Uncharacterized protein n=1 Tax=Pontiella sulfatireligans TaxID=2750658 RepID=A0A6C2UMZ0_9BACT|nr:hypothetical protein [Pontiella sulfatireligans]VGO21642.1 hypothetical protein SCARR_03716 [Pontiella sulfatireligans]
MFEESEAWLFIRARAIEAFVVTAIFSVFPIKHRNITLTDTTLQAPVRTKRWGVWKSVTVKLTEINLSRAFRDRVYGAQLAAGNGEILDLNPVYYPVRSIPKLLNEIERRQENVNNPGQKL